MNFNEISNAHTTKESCPTLDSSQTDTLLFSPCRWWVLEPAQRARSFYKPPGQLQIAKGHLSQGDSGRPLALLPMRPEMWWLATAMLTSHSCSDSEVQIINAVHCHAWIHLKMSMPAHGKSLCHNYHPCVYAVQLQTIRPEPFKSKFSQFIH